MKKILYLLLFFQLFIDFALAQFFVEKEFKLEKGIVYAPRNFNPSLKPHRIFVHLHGSPKVVIENFAKLSVNGILISLHLGSLSSPYRLAFSDQTYFQATIDTALRILRDSIDNFSWHDAEKIYITSFSAGYGGVREILKNEKYYKKINTIILADGLHTDYVSDLDSTNDCKLPNPILLQNFLRFAKDAVKGKKELIVTHSEIYPGSYSSTTECANYLLENSSTERIFAEMYYAERLIQKSYAFRNRFRTFGFYGDTGPDHMQHFFNLPLFIKMLDLN
ncbi:MAG: hypothetical protein FJ213_08535 [Ignavibacteria bacterium]|nr:hypothetical protein [Ignavibacteria bacterium]